MEETARWTAGRIVAIRDLCESTVERCRQDAPRVYYKELIELIFRQPYCTIAFVVDSGIAKRQTAAVYLQESERIGILAGETRGRQVIYRHPAPLEALAT